MDKYSGLWADDPVFSVSPTSSCSAYESDGMVLAGSGEGTCSSCFFCVSSECHNSVTSGLRMAALKISSAALCTSCEFAYTDLDETCCAVLEGVATPDTDDLDAVEQYYTTDGNGCQACPAYRIELTNAIEDEDDYPELDSALFGY